jgi:hypothetical protein
MSLSNKLAITDLDLKDKRVLIRVCDFVDRSFWLEVAANP